MSNSRKNIIFFYLAKIVQMIFPLLITMFLARKYSKSEFGYVVICQSIALLLSAVIEYGFNYSGARDLGFVRSDISKVSEIFQTIISSKIILLFFATVFWITILIFLHIPINFWLGTYILMISQGFNLLWYFQGVDNVLPAILVDIASKAVFITLPFLINISSSEFLLLLGSFQLISQLILFDFIGIRVNFLGHLPRALKALKSGFNLFIFRIGSLAYGGASNMILATVMPAFTVASYGGADKLFRAAAGLTAPVGDAFFANISHQYSNPGGKGKELFFLASKIILGLSILIFLVGEMLADLIIKIVLGSSYAESAFILRILLLSVPLIGLGTIIFVLYLLPRGKDKYFSLATALAGIWTLTSAYYLVPRLGVSWMAYTIVISESIVCLVGVMAILNMRRGGERE